MPSTITAIFIIIVAIFPGVLGNKIYQIVVGHDWRNKEFQIVLRLVGFSVIGAVIYSIVADLISFLPLPIHLIPDTYSHLTDSPKSILTIVYPYLGHLAGGFVAGLLAAWSILLLAKISSSTAYPGAWDDFIRKHVSKHWVIIGLKNGDVYAGKIKSADLSVSKNDRDIVLEEPCLFKKDINNYESLNYQYIFISSENLYSLAVVYDSSLDTRLIPVGEALFKGENKNDKWKSKEPETTPKATKT